MPERIEISDQKILNYLLDKGFVRIKTMIASEPIGKYSVVEIIGEENGVPVVKQR